MNMAAHSQSLGDAGKVDILEIDIPKGGDWLDAGELSTLTPTVLRERMEALKPLIASRARSVEINRRPDPEVWAALRKSGIFYMFVPKIFGGLEMTTEDLIDVMLPVAEACASTCWCATFSIEHNVGFVKGFPLELQKRIFAEYPYIIAPGVQTPPGRAEKVDGGYIVNAHWKWGSGVMNADWILGGVLCVDPDAGPDAPPKLRSVLLPADKVSVPDSWFMAGMAGTGSNDIIVENVFVTEEYFGNSPVFDPAALKAGDADHSSPLLRIPFQTLLALTTMLPAVGAAKAALELAAVRMGTRKVLGTEVFYKDKDSQQARLGKAITQVNNAEILLRDAARQMWAIGEKGEAEFSERAEMRAQVTYVVQLCVDAVTSAVGMSGASAFALDCPLQRYLRDVQTIANHAIYDADVVYEQMGRAFLGLPGTDILT
jgi:3-hydroxy-9,10-secoandrosta-1,3,5(10)-triene-9,17-dione monooxygenase